MAARERGPSKLGGPLYFLGVLLILIPAADFVPNVWPIQIGTLNWRYGMVGLLSGYLLTPALGFAVLAGSAGWLQHRSMLKVTGWLLLVAALALVLLAGAFTMDAIQIRAAVAAEQRLLVEVGAGRAVLKLLLVGVALGWLGVACLRTRFEPRGSTRGGGLPIQG